MHLFFANPEVQAAIAAFLFAVATMIYHKVEKSRVERAARRKERRRIREIYNVEVDDTGKHSIPPPSTTKEDE